MPLLTERPRSLKRPGVKTVKIIHGCGSTGKGGRLRKATYALFDELKNKRVDKRVRWRRTVVQSLIANADVD